MKLKDNNQDKFMNNLEDIQFFDLFDKSEIQELQNLFSDANGVSSVIMDLKGNLLTTPSNYTKLCKMIIQQAPIGSPVYFAMEHWKKDNKEEVTQTVVSPCEKTGLWFETAYISVGDKPIAIWQMGQVRSISYDINQIEKYADNAGLEPSTFLKAYLDAPVVSIYQFERIAKLFYLIANELSEKAYKNLLLKKQIVEIEESEQRFKALHDASFGGIGIHDKGVILECNQGLTDISGFTHQELVGMDGLQLIASDYRDYVMNNIVRGYEKPYEVMGLRKNGEEYPLRLQGKSIPYKGQQVRTVEFRDITEQKLEEAALIKEKEAALESNRLKSEFIANLSHEIRTPMNGILGFADLLKESTITQEEQIEYIDIIEKSGARMLNIINGIIDISKIEAGSMKTNISKFHIKNQMEFVYDFFKSEADAKNLDFKIADLSTLSDLELRSDQEKVNAVLVNLVKNAIKFTEKGQVELGVVKKDNLLEFFVKDTGIGISPQRQKSIFDRFNQDLKEEQKIPHGVGLGLSITKAYIEMLGGSIWLLSEYGEGTTFYFTLPLDIASLKEDSSTKEQINVFNIADLTDLTILIAEDDETSELLLRTYLKPHAKKILSAKNGVEAVEIAKNNPDIDLIMMDIQMPLLNGFLATEKIRKFNSKSVIIAQTAFGLSGDRDKALEAGCNDYIAKPIKKEELKTMIRKYFL